MPGIIDSIIEGISPGVQSEVNEIVQAKNLSKLSSVSEEYSGIRKRALELQTRRTDQEISRLRKLDPGRERLLTNNQIGNLKAVKQQLRNEMTFVERQDAAARKEAAEFNKLTPLMQRAKVNRTLHRSDRAKETAIAGMIERERKQRMKLSRGQFDRVQATAAARRRAKMASRFRHTGKFYRGIERRVPTKRDLPKVRKELEKCMLRHQLREILFARFSHLGHIPRKIRLHGRSSFDERTERREVMHFVRCL